MTMMIDGIEVSILGGEISREEAAQYVQRGRDQYGQQLCGLEIRPDGDFVDLEYILRGRPFQRIRRITGYLVGTLERFNNAKRAEEHDRVKHGVQS